MGASSSVAFKESSMPDLSGKIAVVTGANTGIGLATVEGLAKKNPEKIIVASRSPEKVADAVVQLKKKYPNVNFIGKTVNLSSFKSIENFSADLANTVDRVDILVNNAGIFVPPFSRTEEGFEVTLGSNAVGTAYLTNLVLPLVMRSSAGRIVVLSSGAVGFTNERVFEKYINDIGGEKVSETTLEIYGFSKAVNSLYAQALQKKLKDMNSNVIVSSVDPGAVNSSIQNNTDRGKLLLNVLRALYPFIAKDNAAGAIPVLYCATSPDLEKEKYHGIMFSEGPYCKPFKVPTYFSQAKALQVYDALEKVIHEKKQS